MLSHLVEFSEEICDYQEGEGINAIDGWNFSSSYYTILEYMTFPLKSSQSYGIFLLIYDNW